MAGRIARNAMVALLITGAGVGYAQQQQQGIADMLHGKSAEADNWPEQTFYLANATQPSDENEITTALRNMLDPRVKIYLVPSQNAILVRATPDQLQLAQKLINDLNRPRIAVALDVLVLDVSKGMMHELGSGKNSAVKDATVNLLLHDKDTHVLQNERLLTTHGERATLKVGSKIPVVTSPAAAATPNAAPQFQYLDVGVNIEMTPFVHDGNEMLLSLKIENSMQSGSATIGGISEPVIAQGVVQQVVQVRDGESSVLASSSKDAGQSDIVFLVTPHILP